MNQQSLNSNDATTHVRNTVCVCVCTELRVEINSSLNVTKCYKKNTKDVNSLVWSISIFLCFCANANDENENFLRFGLGSSSSRRVKPVRRNEVKSNCDFLI